MALLAEKDNLTKTGRSKYKKKSSATLIIVILKFYLSNGKDFVEI